MHLDAEPAAPHVTIDNRLGAPVTLADQVRSISSQEGRP
jgi:hypothetical protein